MNLPFNSILSQWQVCLFHTVSQCALIHSRDAWRIPMGRGAWRATVRRVAKSQTRLCDQAHTAWRILQHHRDYLRGGTTKRPLFFRAYDWVGEIRHTIQAADNTVCSLVDCVRQILGPTGIRIRVLSASKPHWEPTSWKR